MEIKQLEYFITTAELGSINKAAKELYTSQPNISKVITAFEKELGAEVFYRTSKGVSLTPEGERLYEYAKVILKNADIMSSIVKEKARRKFGVSCYPSNMISQIVCNYYKKHEEENLQMEFLEDTVEKIVENVNTYRSEIGILYISEVQKKSFEHILGHKNLEFKVLGEKSPCVYVGKNNPLYNRDSIGFSELADLKFVQPSKDFFSMEHHLDQISIGALCMNKFNTIIHTNSDHVLINLLLHTDICSFGIKFLHADFKQYDIKSVDIIGCEKCLLIGYVKRKNEELSHEVSEFLMMVDQAINKS
ncbi:LysR family transcriptional regulator [Cellulosilyticum sp. I15G10I2]|uniref:LysR family transcriptional regulator n=1 Tax=Cellulosilyticum sp. I15G10I2 TaxID=1892843 RepID=UPI00085C4C82|nr:LysR family transcriptional regulator [Cellulosilyticum sp. I15G10I2]